MKTQIEINKENALTANHFEHKTIKNADGSPGRARRNGKTKTWKTRPDNFQIPCKHGMYDYFYITNENCTDFYIPN